MPKDKYKPKVLFLCTGNSCRSQMAEGWARHLWPDAIAAYSAGVKPTKLNADAVRVMAEVGIDISRQCSKHIDDLRDVAFDYVVAVCDGAYESCPVFPGCANVVRHSFDDPPQLTETITDENDRLAVYRRVRDEIRAFVYKLPATFNGTRQVASEHRKDSHDESNSARMAKHSAVIS
ncbi:MAG TPA: arsenate reductase ArsC [Lacipirellulaceae bacterium]|nr:arsenate reductase ArsC [Lacipirellulaceae bacterium]